MARKMIGHESTKVRKKGWGSTVRTPRWFSCFRVLVAILVCAARPDAQSPDLQRVLQQIRTADTGQLSVSEEDGRFLRVMVATSGAKRVLEIGGAFGYSAIWMGLGLRETGGRLTSIEFDPARATIAAAHVRTAGLADIVTVVAGDALDRKSVV